MAYLHDNRYLFQQRKRSYTGRIVVIVLVLGLLIFLFRQAFKSFAYAVAVPVVNFEHVVSRGAYGLTHRKSVLLQRIESLEAENAEFHSKLADYTLLQNENSGLKNSVLSNTSGIVAAVVGRPGKSQYDTLLVDSAPGAAVGMQAYTLAGIPLGVVSDATGSGATVALYSSPGVETGVDIVLGDALSSVSAVLRGRGGGGYEAILPKDVEIPIGSLAISPGLFAKPMAEVVKIVSRDDTKDQIVYLRSIVNFQYLRYIVLTN